MSLIKSTLTITLFSIIGIGLNFITQVLIAYYFGTNFERDAYFIASAIPLYISTVFIGSVGIIFLPKIIDLSSQKSDKKSNFVSTVFWTITLILVIVSTIVMIIPDTIIHLIASSYTDLQVELASKILRIIIPTCILTVLSNILSSLYQIKNNFFRPALAPVFSSVVSLICVLLLNKYIGILSLAVGFLLGSIFSFILLLPILKSYALKMLMDLRDIEIYLFFRTLFPLFLAGIIFRSTNLLERVIASNLPIGSVSYLGYTNQILTILASLTASGIGISIYPTLSKYWSNNDKIGFNIFYQKAFRLLLLISLPIAIIVILYGKLFIMVVFERGAFNPEATKNVALALSISMIAFVFQSLANVVSKTFYISGKTISLSVIASIELFIYLVLGFLLTGYFSYLGLSIALSISCMVNILLSIFWTNYKILKLFIRKLFLDTFKVLLITITSFLPFYLIINYWELTNLFVQFFIIILSFLLYLSMGLFLKIEEFRYIKYKIIDINNRINGRNKMQ